MINENDGCRELACDALYKLFARALSVQDIPNAFSPIHGTGGDPLHFRIEQLLQREKELARKFAVPWWQPG
ncbi:MAG: hypothetical protein ACYDDO_06775 [Acidiferrobacterales bacterium]